MAILYLISVTKPGRLSLASPSKFNFLIKYEKSNHIKPCKLFLSLFVFVPASMSSATLQKRSQAQNIKPPEFHVRSGPAPNLDAEQSSWLVTLIRKFILSCLLWAMSVWTMAKAASSRSWFFILKHSLMRNVSECIVRDKARLTKIPQHLAIVVSNEQTWRGRPTHQWNSIIEDICNTCVWSSEVGIHTVSVFESSGMALAPWRFLISIWKFNSLSHLGFLKRRSAQVQKQLVKAFEDWQLSHAKTIGSARAASQYKGKTKLMVP
jgi:hypothetical protein